MKRTIIAVLAVLMLPATAALANHPATSDQGVDEAWVNEMNQESYWEARFASEGIVVECTKYENHSGFIPAQYDAAVIKDGNSVRVYADLTDDGNFQALGALNPNQQHPNRRFEGPHSWVMKCQFQQLPPETTTTTLPEETTTTTVVQEETTTTVQQETTTTTRVSTTVTSPPTTVPPTTSTPSTVFDPCSTKFEDECFSPTIPEEPPAPEKPSEPELPFTGMNTPLLLAAAIGLVSTGRYLVRRFRDERI